MLLHDQVTNEALAQRASTPNIYGIHGWSSGASTLLNGKGAYSVDMVYSDAWASDPNYRANFINAMATAYNQGFTLIVRIDYKPCEVVPPEWDWVARWTFGERCKDIANQLKAYCRIWVIGNEMQAPYCPYRPSKEWYTTVFGGDSNGVYDKIHSVQADAIVCFGGLGGWPGYMHEADSGVNYLDYFCKNVGGKVDGFAIHTYNGPANFRQCGALDDPRTSDLGSFSAFKAFCDVIYNNFKHNKKVYITEWNTYWWLGGNAPYSEQSYEAGNIQKAYQAIDQWNRASDLKIDALCWYAFAHYGLCPNQNPGDWYHNALQANRCTPAPKLDQARNDFSWTTANSNYRSDVNSNGRLQIEAENYNNSIVWGDTIATGQPGVDYHDTDTGNSGGQYRPDNVDIASGGSGWFVGWTAPGEWLRYTLRGGRIGHYRIEMRYASAVNGPSNVRVLVNGTQVGGTFALGNTGGWNTWQTASSAPFAMTNGVHDVRLVFDTGSVNIDWFAFVPAPAPAAPSNLSATAASQSQINLTWTDNSGVEQNFIVARSTTSGGPYTDIATLPANTTTFSNTGLSANTTYHYVVRAVNATGASPNSNQAAALTWPMEVTIDNSDPAFSASSNWISATSAVDKYGVNYRYRNTAQLSDAATWNYSAQQNRNYEVYAWWSQGSNRSLSAPYIVSRTGGTTTVYRNQQANGGSWQSLGIFNIPMGANTVRLSCWTTESNKVVIADALRIAPRN
ncbi:MAG: carbohydrate-binding protein [Limisphaerales bacterium]